MSELYRNGEVSVNKYGLNRFVVIDQLARYRVRFVPLPDEGRIFVGIDAEWSVDQPGDLANYTPNYGSSCDCQPGEVTISEEGLLSVLAQQCTASITIRIGWTAQLPREAIEPIRRAIALAESVVREERPLL